jgi:hypothetical protein
LRRKERTKPKIQERGREREEDKGALGIQIGQGKKNLKVKCQMCGTNFVGSEKKKKNTHEHVFALDLIK